MTNLKLNKNSLFSSEFPYSDDCVAVSFRMDFYSRKDFIATFQKIAGENIGEFSERLLTDEESQRVDIISVAANLENSANEIMDRKAFIFRWADDEAEDNWGISQVIVSPYFIFVYCRGDKARIASIENRVDTILSYLPHLSEEISIVGMRFSSKFSLYAEGGYFPFMGLRFFNPEIKNNFQSFETIFNEESPQGYEIICKITNGLRYIKIEDTGEIIGNVDITGHSYSEIKCADKDYLTDSFKKLINVTQKYIELCAK